MILDDACMAIYIATNLLAVTGPYGQLATGEYLILQN